MRETARAFVQPQKRGVHYGFFGGKAWMLTPSHFPRMGHVSKGGQEPWTGTVSPHFLFSRFAPWPQKSAGTQEGVRKDVG